MTLLAQVIAYIISPLATLLAVWVAYLSLLRGSQPQLLVYYQPNPDTPSIIDLVIENIGGGTAMGVTFSEHIPINCFGIAKPDGEGGALSKQAFPAVSPGQRYVFIGGQYSGLQSKLGGGLSVVASFRYRTPVGLTVRHEQAFSLSIEHMRGMPTRISANQAIVDALKGPNTTTLQEIRNELRHINQHLEVAAKQGDSHDDDTA